MKISIACDDEYEAKKFASLIFIKEGKETYITSILNVIENELIISLKDKSAHSIVLKDKVNVEKFADFIQSVIDKEHKLVSTKILEHNIEIVKEWIYRVKKAYAVTITNIATREIVNALESPSIIRFQNYYY